MAPGADNASYTEDVPLAPTPSEMGGGGDDDGEKKTYIEQIKAMETYGLTTLYVDWRQLLEREELLALAIQASYWRFLPFLRRAVQSMVRKYTRQHAFITNSFRNNDKEDETPTGGLLFLREFYLAFHNMPLTAGIRQLRMGNVGKLMSISGTVTRTSEVRPELVSGTFKCEVCGTLVHNVEQQFKYTEPLMCLNATCQNRKFWQLNLELSKFDDWQKVRIQENSNEIPTGSMPRS